MYKKILFLIQIPAIFIFFVILYNFDMKFINFILLIVFIFTYFYILYVIIMYNKKYSEISKENNFIKYYNFPITYIIYIFIFSFFVLIGTYFIFVNQLNFNSFIAQVFIFFTITYLSLFFFLLKNSLNFILIKDKKFLLISLNKQYLLRIFKVDWKWWDNKNFNLLEKWDNYFLKLYSYSLENKLDTSDVYIIKNIYKPENILDFFK